MAESTTTNLMSGRCCLLCKTDINALKEKYVFITFNGRSRPFHSICVSLLVETTLNQPAPVGKQ